MLQNGVYTQPSFWLGENKDSGSTRGSCFLLEVLWLRFRAVYRGVGRDSNTEIKIPVLVDKFALSTRRDVEIVQILHLGERNTDTSLRCSFETCIPVER